MQCCSKIGARSRPKSTGDLAIALMKPHVQKNAQSTHRFANTERRNMSALPECGDAVASHLGANKYSIALYNNTFRQCDLDRTAVKIHSAKATPQVYALPARCDNDRPRSQQAH